MQPIVQSTVEPIVFIDVDGVLNPLGKLQDGYTVHRITLAEKGRRRQYQVALNPTHGAALLALAETTGAQLVWGTTWSQHANPKIGPRIGLPELPWVDIGHRPRSGPDSRLTVGQWKAKKLAAWAARRPFVWLEDEPDAAAALAELDGVGPHQVITVDALRGLTAQHLQAARDWLDQLRADLVPPTTP
ncbi:HAD domain-containing protein [Actinomadura kijaniata]|uniref:HAD domain-containing protein n=1 Tax=Actinomadura kijaniata TaxID=46161 RepID=UPI000A03F192|nr:HAD domain-containing protein [Actinomadura kijaniata]